MFANAYVVNLATVIVNVFVFLPLALAVVAKGGLLQRVAANLTMPQVFVCVVAAVLLIVGLVRQSHYVLYDETLLGWRGPQQLKPLLEAIPFDPAQSVSDIIMKYCLVAGVASFLAMTVALLLLWEFARFVWQKQPLLLLAGDESAVSERAAKNLRLAGYILLGFMTVIMISFANAQSFWTDELTNTIGFVANRNFAELTAVLLEVGYNMPLQYYALALIYPFMPYGEGYLLSISIAAVVAGLVFLGKAAREIGGETFASLTLIIAALSSSLLTKGAWELRPYPFLFCFSALTVWLYYRRVRNENWQNILWLALAMTLLAYTHWFGALMLVFYGLGDLYLWLRKRVKLRCAVSYLATIAAVMPWYVAMLLMLQTDLRVNATGVVPNALSLVNSLEIALDSSALWLLVFALAAVVVAVTAWQAAKAKEYSQAAYLWLHTLLCIAWTLLLPFIYSRFINPAGSCYLERYFFILAPHAILLSALGVKGLLQLYPHKRNIPRLAALLAVVGVVGYASAISSATRIHQPFREAAWLLAERGDIYRNDTAVLSSAGDEAWLEYYFRKRGLTVPVNMIQGETMLLKDGEAVHIPLNEDEIYAFDRLLTWYSYHVIPQGYRKTVLDEETNLVLYEKQ
jgi:hypothetical protein